MSRVIVTIMVGALLCAVVAVGQAQTSEPVRINVKEALIEISLSRDTWWLKHGWVGVTLDVTDGMGMTEEQVEAFLLQYYLFELSLDGVAVGADGITLGHWTPPGLGDHWVIQWQFSPTFTPGVHALVGTWSLKDMPCVWLDEGDCDPLGWPQSPGLPNMTYLQPWESHDGLLSVKWCDTLILVVLP